LGVLSVAALGLYKADVFWLGIYLVPFAGLLLLTGWTIGFFVSGMIIRYGTRVQALAWTFSIILTPFCAIYYPLSALPRFAQVIGAALPTSYIFEGMRHVLATGRMDRSDLGIGIVLGL